MSELVKEIERVAKETQNFAEHQLEYIRLDTVDRSAKAVSQIATWLLLGIIGLMALAAFSLVMGILISHWTGSEVIGFSILAAFYFLLLILGFIFRKKWITIPLRNKIIQSFID